MQAGTVVAQRFVIEHLAGEGGMGEVYRATDIGSGTPVALKVLRSAGAQTEERFQREVAALERLSHPAIVACLGHGVLPGERPWLAMEWLEGEDLARRITRGPLMPEDALTIARTVAEALGAAHAIGVVHRDVKPHNVFLVDRDPARVKVIDFGLARVTGTQTATLTGALVGTPAYMAPEQIRGARDVDGRADLYALGALLFECLTGQKPFVATDHILGVISQILFEPAPRLRAIAPSMPPELDALVAALLEKDPERRLCPASEVATALSAIDPSRFGPRPVLTERPPSLTGEELRLVSVVLLAAAPLPSTSPLDDTVLERRDPELVQAVTRVAAPLGGRIEALGDGTVLVALAGRGAATDQATAAARCALEMRALGAGRPLALTTGRGSAGAGSLFSDAAARAGALLRVAPADTAGIVIDETTRGLLDARFALERLGDLHVLVGEDPSGEPSRQLAGRTTPFVGREREVGYIERLFEDVVGESRAAAAVVVGEAGAGKSRLGREVLASFRRIETSVEIWVGRGEPLSAGASFGLIASALRDAAKIRDGAPAEVRHDALCAFLDARVAPGNAERLTTFLGELVEAPRPGADEGELLRAARRDPMLMGDQIRLAFEDLVEGVTTSRPLVLVLEDLHWGDGPTVKLLDRLLRNLHASPLFVLALGRPETLELFPGIFAEREVHHLRLSGLSRRAAATLVRRSLGDEAREEDVQVIVDRAAGHPLFLEELARAAVESSGSSTLPETVLAMVQSRIERLPFEARRILRAASIFGETFWRGGVTALVGDALGPAEVEQWISLLCDREVVEARREARFPDEREYGFRHALFREAAYAMLTPADCEVGHALAGAWLEAAGETRAAVLAEHFDQGSDLERAVVHHHRAAREALEAGDFVAVNRHVDRGIARGAAGRFLGECLAFKAEAAHWQGAFEEAERLAEEAMRVLEPATPRWFEAASAFAIAAGRRLAQDKLASLCGNLSELGARGEQSDAYIQAAIRAGLQAFIAGQYEVSQDLLRRILPCLEDPSGRELGTQALLQVLAASRASRAWRYDATARHFLEAAAIFERAGDLRSACSQRLDACFFFIDLGDAERACELCHELLAAANRLGLSRILSAARGSLGGALYVLGQHDEALVTLSEAERDLDTQGDMRLGGLTRIKLARCLLAQGELDAAAAKALEARRLLAGMRRYDTMALSVLALIRLAQGDVPAALEHSEAAMAILASIGRMGTDEIGVRLARVLALRAGGDSERMRVELAAARERVSWMASRLDTEEARQRFLSRVTENRRVLELAAEEGITGG
ncbi:serine/threonine-protein kinase [Polyangium jinanense]|uniref:Protein kinase n=1 Tax=Polyangium jinanense TaxID=2829994 RepID=A0A9X3XIS3_9BACT|nr:serine/threonine-protein kinase [Polyangium jinanense]MDC3962149.1 protein kinase [Polyangium jinanense]MDC3988846.1 protein kinase [Polyangium jinanense]